MADEEKTEQPTGKKLSEAWSRGQFARSREIQTVFVFTAGLVALSATAGRILDTITGSMTDIFGQLNHLSVTFDSVELYFTALFSQLARCVLPVMFIAVLAGIIAGAIQTRLHLTPKVLEMKWEKLNPIKNAQNLFKPVNSLARGGVTFLKFLVILGFAISAVRQMLDHPIFHTPGNFEDVLIFMAQSAQSVAIRVIIGMVIVAIIDYAYQIHKNQKSLMMTKKEVKDETKAAEGNPKVKGELRRRRMALLRQQWTQQIPQADVIVTNPTHLAIALRYDRDTMRAPRVVARGARYNALRIREIARQFQIPIVENKPVAQMLFKFCREGQEVPAAVYGAVAEILAYVYRTNRSRYYLQGQNIPS